MNPVWAIVIVPAAAFVLVTALADLPLRKLSMFAAPTTYSRVQPWPGRDDWLNAFRIDFTAEPVPPKPPPPALIEGSAPSATSTLLVLVMLGRIAFNTSCM